ncbi:MAG: PLP-dependent aminotransferase family protein [candidate division Zixibacteria bacterium]|nr:PLP-dependent aminotransferase family protein [candidate division Zixibacteria bacterium]MBU1470564.1 PLP-dependent aminotransferase family protein [candidate division Zixibacteria bacterium]MBU2624462.1 PLP-dependent aminotransferase family protein [candidate division Zixibacteria bacterium]
MIITVDDLHETVIKEWPFSVKAVGLEANIIREILKVSSKPGLINFAGGLPAPELFPQADLKSAAVRGLEKYGPAMLQYSLSQGVTELREQIAARLSEQIGMEFTSNIIQITSGSQQGLDLVGRAFLNPGDYVLTERPTYLGALQAFNLSQAKYCTARLEEDGMNIQEAEEQIKKYNPKLIYVVPNFQNPAGLTTSTEKRQAIVDLSKKYQVPIIDDNPYGELRYRGERQKSFKELGGNAVIQLGTFSKIVAPGLRIGFLAACPEVMQTIERIKQSSDLHANTFAQYMIVEYIQSGRLDGYHIPLLIEEYGKRRDTMIKAMEREFPSSVTFTQPDGGLFLWVTLPEHVSVSSMLNKAVEAGVAFVPGKPFYPHGDTDHHLRLNFCNATQDRIKEGIKRLAVVFHDTL